MCAQKTNTLRAVGFNLSFDTSDACQTPDNFAHTIKPAILLTMLAMANDTSCLMWVPGSHRQMPLFENGSVLTHCIICIIMRKAGNVSTDLWCCECRGHIAMCHQPVME